MLILPPKKETEMGQKSPQNRLKLNPLTGSKPHLKKAHQFWREYLRPTDVVIDATCGNGKDTAALARLVPQGHVYALDIQEEAFLKARKNVLSSNVTFLKQCHSELSGIFSHEIRLVVYNLGYLPGGDKQLTTMTQTTLKSISLALQLMPMGGALSITCYPGHPEGALEELALQEWSLTLSPQNYHVQWSTWGKGSPSLLLVQLLN